MGTYSNGRFDLCVTLTGVADSEELAFLVEFFTAVSHELYDATDGQHALGKVLLSEEGFGSEKADLTIQDGADAYAGSARLWKSSGAITYGRENLGNVTLATHELAHYLYDTRDEYSGPDPAGGPDVTGLACCAEDAQACLMDNRNGKGATGWYYGSNPTPLTDWTSLKILRRTDDVTFERGQPSEFCHPSPTDPSLAHDVTVPNYQNVVHGLSCWETLIDPGTDGKEDYGLVLPGTGPAMEPPLPPDPEVLVLIDSQRFALVLDRSGSMAGVKLQQLKLAAKFWADWVEASEEFGIVSYAGSPTVDVPLAEVPSEAAAELAAAVSHKAVVDALNAAGMTAIGDALRAGLDLLTQFGRAADQVLVLVTDGLQTAGSETPQDVVPDLIARGVRVITIGVGADLDAVLLESIATATGGEYRPIPAGDATDDKAEEIATLLIEIAGTVRVDSAVTLMMKLAPDASENEAERPPDERRRSAPFRDIEVLVAQGARQCTLGAVWFGAAGDFRVELLDPLGRVIGHSSSTRLCGGAEAYSFGTLDDPLPGKWTVRVHGAVRAVSRVRVFGFEQRAGLRLSVDCSPRFLEPNGTLRLRARLHAPMPVPGAEVRARVSDSQGWSRVVELPGVELREGGHAPPHAYQAELQLPDDLRGPVTIHVEARHRGGRVRVELDGRGLSRPDLEIERAIAGVHVPECVRTKRIVLRLASEHDRNLPFRRGRNTVPTWVPAGQQRWVDAWNARHRRR